MMLRGLSRTSSKSRNRTHHPYLIVTATSNGNNHRRAAQLPTEILDLIIKFLLSEISPVSPRARLSSISAFSQASVSFRQIALRNFLRVLSLISISHWNGLYRMITKQESRTEGYGGFMLIKTIVTSTRILTRDPLKLQSLTNIQTLGLTFETEGLSTQHSCLESLCSNLASHKLTVLILNSLPRIDVSMLKQIARSFPCLISLTLSVIERLDVEQEKCPCWYCFDDLLETCLHSPIPERFRDAEHLADMLGSALQPLTKLTRIHLGILLSPEHLIYDHALHDDRFPEDGVCNSPAECFTCENQFYDIVRADELLASKVMAEKVNTLQAVSWATYFYIPKTQDNTIGVGEIKRMLQKPRTSSRKQNVVKDGKAKFLVIRETGQVVVTRNG